MNILNPLLIIFEKKWFIFINGIFILLCSVLIMPNLFYDDYDIWWNLAYGRHFVENKTMYIDDFKFQYTPTPKKEVIDVNWLGSSILYTVYRIFGRNGLVFFKLVCQICIFLLMIMFIIKISSKLGIIHFVTIFMCSLFFIGYFDIVNQHMLTLVMFVSLTYIIFDLKSNSSKLLWQLPLIMIFWINLHHGAFLGYGYLFLIFIGEILNRRLDFRNFILFLFSFFTILFNPYGIKYPINFIQRFFSKGSMLKSNIKGVYPTYHSLFSKIELNSMSFKAWLMVIMFFILVLVMVTVWKKRRSIDYSILFSLVFLFYYAMMYRLIIAFFSVFFFFSLYYLLNIINVRISGGKCSLCALILFIVFFSSLLQKDIGQRTFLFSGDDMIKYAPEGACSFMLDEKIAGPIYNTYREGGYIIWRLYPDYKVFIDPRFYVYSKTFLRDVFSVGSKKELTEQTFEKTILGKLYEKYGFKSAIIRNERYGVLSSFLKFSKKWQLAYIGKISSVIVLRNEKIKTSSREYFTKYLSPERFNEISDPQILEPLFDIYDSFDKRSASIIMKTYEKNVRKTYFFKDRQVKLMKRMLM